MTSASLNPSKQASSSLRSAHTPNHTWVSGSSDPRLAAPSFTTSARRVMVVTEDWAAWASFSWLAVAFCTNTLVSSTSALAVFKMPSLGRKSESGRTQPCTAHVVLGVQRDCGPWVMHKLEFQETEPA